MKMIIVRASGFIGSHLFTFLIIKNLGMQKAIYQMLSYIKMN